MNDIMVHIYSIMYKVIKLNHITTQEIKSILYNTLMDKLMIYYNDI